MVKCSRTEIWLGADLKRLPFSIMGLLNLLNPSVFLSGNRAPLAPQVTYGNPAMDFLLLFASH